MNFNENIKRERKTRKGGRLTKLPLIVPVLCSGQNILKFSKTIGPTEAKFPVAPPWDRGKDGKLIQMI